MISLFDLHCDMPTEAYGRKRSITDGSLMASAAKASGLDRYVQVAAIWSDCRLDDEAAYRRYREVRDNFRAQVEANRFTLATCADQLDPNAPSYILAVEDARILAGDLSRLEELYRDGVRFLTLTWAGESVIGGSFDTSAPLTEFGRRVVEECFRLGIVPDLSHASDPVIEEVLEMAEARGLPVVATHSNAYRVHPHPRNLKDSYFERIVALGGLVGISFYPVHLCDGPCNFEAVLAHIRHYLSLGGESCLAFGGDFDGIETTPEGLADLSAMPELYRRLAEAGLDSGLLDRLFYQNAHAFFARGARIL
ncbi:MAG: membrane dipeptidase [Clostridia bacterium]|nr:membrane dipeptidase [Clostridia bacterium]